MLRNPGLRKSVEQPVLDLNFAAAQIGSNAAPDSRIDFSRGTNAWFVDSDGLVKKSPHNLLVRSEDLATTSFTKSNVTVTNNAASAPDGTTTATKLEKTANAYANVNQNFLGATATHAASLYLKAGTNTTATVLLTSDDGSTLNSRHRIDLSAGTITNLSSANMVTTTIEDVGDGWYRFTTIATFANNTNTRLYIYPDVYNQSNAGFVYIWHPQVSQHTTLPVGNPYIKTEGSAVYAARLDHDPAWFMSAAQEQNLLRYSEMLDQGGGGLNWGLQKVNVTANAGTDPLGGSTAELVLENSQSGAHTCKSPDFDVTAGKVYTASCYLKLHAGNRQFRLAFSSGAGGFDFAYAQFIVTNETCVFYAGDTTYKVEDVGNGWFRISIQSDAATENSKTGQVNFQFISSGSTNYQGDGTSGFLIWGTQVEVGSTAGTYHRTEGAPYYGPGATPKGLLIEEARTNLLTNSNDLTVDDGLSSTVSNTQNAALGPDGTVTAAKLAANTTTPNNGRVFYPASGITLGAGTYTYSIFLKKAEVSFVKLRIGVSGDFPGVFFNLTNGTVGTASSGFTGKIVDYGNGYFRCSITATLSAAHYFAGVHLASADNTLLSSATIGDGVFMWGHLLELGSFPTSYIETTGSTATRNADVATMGPTVAPDKLGTELIVDGDFSSLDNFTQTATGNFSVSGGILEVEPTANFSRVYQSVPTEVGKRYRASVFGRTESSSDGYALYAGTAALGGDATAYGKANSQTTDFLEITVDFTATTTTAFIGVGDQGSPNTTDSHFFHTLSLKEILPGTELVTNGTFDTDSDWIVTSAASITGGELVYSSAGQYKNTDQIIAGKFVAGRRYRFSCEVTSYTSGTFKVIYLEGATNLGSTTSTSTGSVTFDFTCVDDNPGAGGNRIRLQSFASSNNTFAIDNVSVRELYPFEQYRPDQGTMVVAFDTQSTGFRGPWWFSRGGASSTGWGLRLNSTTTIDAMVRDSSNFNSLSNLTITPDFDIVAASYEQRASDTFCSVSTATNFDDDGHVNDIDVSVDTLDIGQCKIGGSDTGISSGHIKRLQYFPIAMNDETKLKNMCDD